MTLRAVFGIGITAVVLTIFAVGLFLIFGSPIARENLQLQGPFVDGNEYVLRFHDNNQDELASATAEVHRVSDGLYRVRANVWHPQGTQLDSLTLELRTGAFSGIALQVPDGYPWPPMHYHITSDGQATLVHFSHLDVQGSGSVTLEFLMGSAVSNTQPVETFDMGFAFTMHEERPFVLRSLQGAGTFTVQLPEAVASR